MGDKRLNKRAKTLLENLSRDASLSIPNANWQREDTSVNKSKKTDKESQGWLAHYESACHFREQSPDTTAPS